MFKGKTFNIVLSVGLAILLWTYVVVAVNPQATKKFSDIPIELLNENSLDARNLAIVESGNITVDVVLEGNKTTLSDITIENITATADLFGRSKGKNHIPVSVQVPKNVKISEVSPKNIIVNIEDKESQERDVELDIEGDLPQGYKLTSSTITPTQITVSGAESLIKKISRVVAVVDGTKISNPETTVSANVIAVDAEGKVIENLDYSRKAVTVAMEFAIDENAASTENQVTKKFSFRASEVDITNLKAGLKGSVTSEKIEVILTGKTEDLKTLTKEKIKLSVDARQQKIGEYSLGVKIKVGASIKSYRVSPETVTVVVSK